MTLSQPDGSKIECFATGDEYYHFLHTADGYVINQSQDGYYYFSEKNSADLELSKFRVSNNDPNKLPLTKWLMPDASVLEKKRLEFETTWGTPKAKNKKQSNRIQSAKIGEFNNIVILIQFPDQNPYTKTLADFESVYNATTGNSVKNYYKEVSYGQLNMTTYFLPGTEDQIHVKPCTAPYNRGHYVSYNETTNPDGYTDYASRSQRLKELLDRAVEDCAYLLPSGVDFDNDNDNNADNVTFVVQGASENWQDLLWPMRSYYSGEKSFNGLQLNDFNFVMSDFIFPRYGGFCRCRNNLP